MANETEKERQLFAYQTMEDIVDGRFPVNKELAIELAGVMAQVGIWDLLIVLILSNLLF